MRPTPRSLFHLQMLKRRRARRRVAECLLRSANVKALNHGAYSSVFALGPRHVLKVTDDTDPTAAWCRHWMRGHPNVHWPRTHRAFRTRRHHAFLVERLWPLLAHKPKRTLRSPWPENGYKIRLEQADGAADLLVYLRQVPLETLLYIAGDKGEAWQLCPPRLRRLLLPVYQAGEAKGFRRDGKREAFMWRHGGVLILADPFIPPDKMPVRQQGRRG